MGRPPYHSDDESRNNVVFGVLALGEGWHNNHHAFPTSARHGLRWWQIDVSYWVIRGLALVRPRLEREVAGEVGWRDRGLMIRLVFFRVDRYRGGLDRV